MPKILYRSSRLQLRIRNWASWRNISITLIGLFGSERPRFHPGIVIFWPCRGACRTRSDSKECPGHLRLRALLRFALPCFADGEAPKTRADALRAAPPGEPKA